MYLDNMLHNLPQIYRQDLWLQSLLQATALIAESIALRADSLPEQILMDSATWALPIYEKELGIKPGAQNDDRRAAIAAKWKSGSKCDLALLTAIANSWKNNFVRIEFDNGEIVVTFGVTLDTPCDFTALIRAFDEVKPAHLPIRHIFMTPSTLAQLDVLARLGRGHMVTPLPETPYSFPNAPITIMLAQSGGYMQTALMESQYQATNAIAYNIGAFKTITQTTLPSV